MKIYEEFLAKIIGNSLLYLNNKQELIILKSYWKKHFYMEFNINTSFLKCRLFGILVSSS